MQTKRYAHRMPSFIGDVWIVVDEEGALTQLDFHGGRNAPRDERDLERSLAARGHEVVWDARKLAPVVRALEEYFRGERRRFDLPVNPEGTEFQRLVWRELPKIPYGATWSYGRLAKRLGREGGARAVGRANATNPISVVIPCHRVVGADGALTGYGGGMERKEALLRLEGVLL